MAIGLGRMFGFRFPGELPLAVHRRHACRSSGGAGTSRCRPGSATTSTSRSAATASPGAPLRAISSPCSSCAACGTARAGTSSSGACGTARFWWSNGCRDPQSAPDQPITRSPIRRLAWPIWPHVYTLLVVMIGWVFFRAETLPGAIAFLEAMAGLTARGADAVHRRLVPDARAVARARRRRDRIDAVGPGAGARRDRDERPRALERRRCSSTAALMALLVAVDHADGRAHLQPVHLFPVLMNRAARRCCSSS